MAEIDFLPLDAVYKLEGDKTVIYLYGKSNGEKVCIKYDNFEPYFLAEPKAGETEKLVSRLKNFKTTLNERVVSITNVEIVKKKRDMKELVFLKCSTIFPDDIPGLSRELLKIEQVAAIEERDIKFINRFLIDNNIIMLQKYRAVGEFEAAKSRIRVFKATGIFSSGEDIHDEFNVLAVDIETPARGNQPEKYPILMIGLYSKNFQRVITWKRFQTALGYVEFVENEKAMIERFGKIVEELGPDFICGYYSDVFDFPYIKARAEILGVDLKPGMNFSSIRVTKKESFIEGLPHIDVFKFIRYVWGQGLDTTLFDLDSVAREILKDGKVGVDIGDLGKLWETDSDLSLFCEYNLKDAELCWRLCEKIMPDIIEFVKLTMLTPYQVSRSRFSRLVEGHLISQAYERGVIARKAPAHDDIGDRRRSSFQGAFVFEPSPGLYKRIAVFDFKSLYPTIISAHNISPETLKCSCCRDEAPKIPGRNDLWFCQKTKGFIPIVMRELVTRRMRLGEILKKGSDKVLSARNHALKTLANAMYGYLGFSASRWYCFECALSITALGRDYLNKLIEKAQVSGFDVVYGDTDSVFLHLKDKEISKALLLADEINSELPDIMELKFEGFFPAGLFVSIKDSSTGAKKKYALIDEHGNLKIRGFESVRRNWSLLARDAQRKVLEIVLRDNDIEAAKAYIRELVSLVRENAIEKKKMIIKTQIQKPISEYEAIGPHVAVAKKLQDKGQEIVPGDIIEYVVLKGSGSIGNRAMPADSVDLPDYDTDYYVKNQIIPAVESIFRELGVAEADILQKDQSSLSKFF